MILNTYHIEDMALIYTVDEAGRVGMQLLPWARRDEADDEEQTTALAQLYLRGDSLPNSYGSGHTLCWSGTSEGLRLAGQTAAEDEIVTELHGAHGLIVRHRVRCQAGVRALRVTTEAENAGDAPFTLEMLASATLAGLCAAPEQLLLHRACSAWSAEGRWVTQPIEQLSLERSWTGHAIRTVRFGQIGSMPVRGYFPFAAMEDTGRGVTWAVQLACPSSWQIEVTRRFGAPALTAGLADYEYGHWAKTLTPGERFETPEAYLTAAQGEAEAVSQRLLDIHRQNWVGKNAPLPVVFNEYCTTWGCPSHENMMRLTHALTGHDIDYVVMDCGWYGREGVGWSDCGGDWLPNDALFPDGIRATADGIHAAGFKAGIWFEPETCAQKSAMNERTELLLTRSGRVIDTANRRFLDLRKDEVRAYLQTRMIDLLRDAGFDYVKIDYNDCIGLGCDSEDGLGEGLRQNQQETLALFRGMQAQLPGLMLENCASGGHRLEPSLLGASWLASFSDAHEQPEIPVIAASLHRLMLPGQSLIWAVLRPEDSIRRINYSMAATLLGVMCLSGDVYSLSDAQWAKVDEGIRFYRDAQAIIRDGESRILGDVSAHWQQPEGWQAVIRRAGSAALVVLHTFEGRRPAKVTLDVPGMHAIRSVLCSEGNAVSLEGERLTIDLRADFEAVAVLLDA